MGNEIQKGMNYGSYDNKLKELGEKYIKQPNEKAYENGYESECIFRDTETGTVKGNAYRENIFYSENGVPKYSDAIIFTDGFIFGTSSKTFDGLDKFDYIQSKNQYAIDFNGNGKVEQGEIFSGTLDKFSYEKAKTDGDLRKYTEYQKQYNYNWQY